tara:strand:- start:663 stop:1175 length:513 start_codon:yes stop_codon:yes gene_type:complete
MFFKEFPLYQYDFDGKGQNVKLVTDLLRRVALRSKVSANTLLFDKYDVKDGQTPEIVAELYYGNSQYHWVVVLLNHITSWYDWPLESVAYSNYLLDQYGTNIEGTHHHEISQTSGDTTIQLEVSSDTTGATAVTNREYEDRLQDEKRQIRLIDRTYLRLFVEEFKKIIKR